MSLVYNNKKLIGKCSKYAIEKVQGTSPFVMLENFEPKQPQLNENQQIVLGQLKINAGSNGSLIKAIHSLFNLLTISSNQLEKDCTDGLLKSKNALARLTRKQAAEVLSAFAQWSLEQEED